jgi:hypothetical protein
MPIVMPKTMVTPGSFVWLADRACCWATFDHRDTEGYPRSRGPAPAYTPSPERDPGVRLASAFDSRR